MIIVLLHVVHFVLDFKWLMNSLVVVLVEITLLMKQALMFIKKPTKESFLNI
jgi:hypothetical protein